MAIIDGENRLTMLELYNDITAQAWSMFDSEVDSQEEFEQNVTTSIQKSLMDLWLSYPFPFREKTHILKTRPNKNTYAAPVGNIKKGKSVWLGNKPLKYLEENRALEEKFGEPEYYYVKQDNIYFYPIPDNVYFITIDYLSLYPVCNSDGEDKATLEDETDYINIPERYQQLFKVTLMPLTMWNYLIASESDENSSAYEIQYKRAYNNLLKYTQGFEKERSYGWK